VTASRTEATETETTWLARIAARSREVDNAFHERPPGLTDRQTAALDGLRETMRGERAG